MVSGAVVAQFDERRVVCRAERLHPRVAFGGGAHRPGRTRMVAGREACANAGALLARREPMRCALPAGARALRCETEHCWADIARGSCRRVSTRRDGTRGEPTSGAWSPGPVEARARSLARSDPRRVGVAAENLASAVRSSAGHRPSSLDRGGRRGPQTGDDASHVGGRGVSA
jgi:hypothetical protein